MRFPWSSKKLRRVRHKPLLQVPFVGRDSIVEALDTHLQAACQGAPQYVVLEGPAGSGKSALLTEFRLLQCHGAKFYVAQVNAGDCLVEAACMSRLLTALQRQSEAILRRLYDDTKRIRKALAIDWDEAEFRTFLASADWARIQDEPVPLSRGTPSRGDALTQLLNTVREHPWGIGAATILDSLSQRGIRAPDASAWLARWTALLRAMQTRGVTPGSALVIIIDQLDAPPVSDAARAWRWESFWRDFVAASETVSLPLMILWSGTADSVAPVRQALEHPSTAAVHQLEALTEEAQQELLHRLQRALPREGRDVWQQAVTATGAMGQLYPGHLMLAATSAAAWAERGGTEAAFPQGLIAAEAPTWVERLIESSRRQTVEESVFRQFLEACAFLPPGQDWTIEELLLLCHPETVGLDPVDGRTILENLLGQWVRYGLLRYNAFDSQYSAGDSLTQEAIRQWLHPDAVRRRQVAVQRQTAAAVLTYVQQGDTAMLAALGGMLQEMAAQEGAPSVTEHVLPSFRHMVWTLTKDERQHVAASLEALPVPMVLEMLRMFLSDEEGQVRSRAAQSLAAPALAQAPGVDTFPLLRDALQDDNSDVRWIAANALRTIEGAATVDALIPLLTDEDKEVGRIAADGLGQQGDRRAVPHLIAAMRDSYPMLRESAALALGQLADRRALPALQELSKDDSPRVRRSAETALACFAPLP